MDDSIKQRFDLTGKVAVVTGASKGIGEAIARALGEFGATVVVSSRRLEAVEAVAEQLRAAGIEASAVAAHMGDMAQARALMDEVIARHGGVDIIVNNAATNPVFGPMMNADESVFQKIMAVNVQGPLELCKRAVPVLRSRGGGSIVNIASVGGLNPERMLGLYSVSKSALISLTKVMAKEWGGMGIRANAICPGLIKTKFSQALWQNDQVLKQALAMAPISRIGMPQDLAGLAVFLASDAASYCTGGVFVADGGLTV
ncbi:MAG TPA: glucose 1-dehydrogenase [Candidatus Macondimonas sp.]|nr:glucose 1-dehydrogenase [Candidatus Macondimonas sp.]